MLAKVKMVFNWVAHACAIGVGIILFLWLFKPFHTTPHSSVPSQTIKPKLLVQAKPYTIVSLKNSTATITAPTARTPEQRAQTVVKAWLAVNKNDPSLDIDEVDLVYQPQVDQANTPTVVLATTTQFGDGKSIPVKWTIQASTLWLTKQDRHLLHWLYEHHANLPWLTDLSYSQWKMAIATLSDHFHLHQRQVFNQLYSLVHAAPKVCAVQQGQVVCDNNLWTTWY